MSRPSLKREVKQRLLNGSRRGCATRPPIRAGFRAREASARLIGDFKYRGFEGPDGLPIPPARLRVAVSGIADPHDHLDAGRRSAEAIAVLLERNSLEVGTLGSLLDFGCGSGRVARQWAGLPEVAIHGCDYNADAIAWCQANLPFASWAANRLDAAAALRGAAVSTWSTPSPSSPTSPTSCRPVDGGDGPRPRPRRAA